MLPACQPLPLSQDQQLNISGSPLFFTHRQLIMERVAALHLPAIYEWPETAEEGGFAAYGGGLLIDCCYADMA